MKKHIAVLMLMISVLSQFSACSGIGSKGLYYIDRFYVEGEGDELRSGVEEMTVDLYRWYQSIEGEEGVYILHSSHYTREIMKAWRDSGYNGDAPDMDLWYFAASPNYLKDAGLEISAELLSEAEDGVRLYLIPDSYSDEGTQQLIQFLTSDALHGLDDGYVIDTVFQNERRINFGTCRSGISLGSSSGGNITDPVIYVATSRNMKYFESESLIATGREDAYIRLTEEAYERFVRKDFPEELTEKQITFTRK